MYVQCWTKKKHKKTKAYLNVFLSHLGHKVALSKHPFSITEIIAKLIIILPKMPYIDHLSWFLICEQNKYVTSLMNNQPIFHPVDIKYHQQRLKRSGMVMSCFRIFQGDEISVSTATFVNMKKRGFMSMPSLFGQSPLLIFIECLLCTRYLSWGCHGLSRWHEVDIITAILTMKKLEFREIKWFVQNDTLNKNSSSEFKFKYIFFSVLCSIFRRNTDFTPNGLENRDLTVLHS